MAQGSTTTYGGWEPRVCCICEQPIVKTRDAGLRFHMNDVTGEVRSWHRVCELEHGWPGTVAA